MLSANERNQLIKKLNISFCVPELLENKDSFLNLSDEQYKSSVYDLSAAIILQIITGNIAEVPHLMNLYPDVGFQDFIKPMIPTVSNRDFLHSLYRLNALGVSLEPYYSTVTGLFGFFLQQLGFLLAQHHFEFDRALSVRLNFHVVDHLLWVE